MHVAWTPGNPRAIVLIFIRYYFRAALFHFHLFCCEIHSHSFEAVHFSQPHHAPRVEFLRSHFFPQKATIKYY